MCVLKKDYLHYLIFEDFSRVIHTPKVIITISVIYTFTVAFVDLFLLISNTDLHLYRVF